MMLLALTPFQQVLLVVVTALVVGSVAALVRGWSGKREGMIWLAVWLAAGVAVIWPGATSSVAGFLGVGRGADLIFYCAILVLLCGLWMIYLRLREIRREITVLVRRMAILEADHKDSHAASPRSTNGTGPTSARGDGNGSSIVRGEAESPVVVRTAEPVHHE